MQIDDPFDAIDIATNRELYKYDYLNEEISQIAAEATERSDGNVTITIYFGDDEEGLLKLREARELVSAFGAGKEDAVSYETSVTGDDSEWLYRWQEYFKPTKVGERIVVKPGWEDYEAANGELVIEMDPGMAFGSGLHETTSMCIKALEKIMPGAAGADGRTRVLDVGTGTGILAIAAALLGADDCLGIDIDTDAVRVACENIAHNGLDDRIRAQYGDLTAGVDYRADIIVANLMADLVVILAKDVRRHLKPGGLYVSSGILAEKKDEVAAKIRDAGFEIVEIYEEEEWVCIVAR
jgi:ribosomal protein L11 methyltransferase